MNTYLQVCRLTNSPRLPNHSINRFVSLRLSSYISIKLILSGFYPYGQLQHTMLDFSLVCYELLFTRTVEQNNLIIGRHSEEAIDIEEIRPMEIFEAFQIQIL